MALAAIIAASLSPAPVAIAQGGSPQNSGSHTDSGQSGSHETGGHDSSTHGTDEHGAKGKDRGKGAAGSARGQTGGRSPGVEGSLRGKGAGRGGAGAGRGGQAGGGSAESGKGQLFGDMWVVLRDANGAPILNAQGFRQPLDVKGNPIPLDAEGGPVDESQAVQVELGRLNVGRSPGQVLDRRMEEVSASLSAATAVRTDEAGRLVFTIDGQDRTIDSPLENLAIYRALVTTGSIPGVADLPGDAYDFLVDGRKTPEDLKAAASFLAGAADKSTPIGPDSVAYLDTVLQISLRTEGDVTYSAIDYSGFAYDRAATYGGKTAEILVKQSDGSLRLETVNVYQAVFNAQAYHGENSLTAYAQAADDARAVIAYIHDNGPRGESEEGPPTG